jgi:hypothetical protein
LINFNGSIGLRSFANSCLPIACASLLSAVILRAEEPTEWHSEVQSQGVGGAYFMVEPGEFWVEIEKQDLNRRDRETHLRAILVGPDRSVIEERFIPDDGLENGAGPGPVQRVRLSTNVPRSGIYGLNITVTEDRYGEEFVCGIDTNCSKYLIETSRGHRDAPHEEPIVLANPERAGEVCFQPRRDAFSIEVSGLQDGVDSLILRDATDATIATIPGANGSAKQEIPAATIRENLPWRLQFPKLMGTLQIDGVTRWSSDDDFPNCSLWTPDATTWFSFPENRWLLSPYHRTIYGEPGSSHDLKFDVHNSGLVEKSITLELEDPPDVATISESEMRLLPGESAPVHVQFEIPKVGPSTFYVRATPSDGSGISTYSAIHAHAGETPAAAPLTIPLVLRPYMHENAQFGYLPDYPLTNQPYFDLENRPVIVSESGVLIDKNGMWTEITTASTEDGVAAPFQPQSTKVGFGANNEYYLLATQEDQSVLLHSRDQGEHFVAYPIPGRGRLAIEQFSGHNIPPGPPPLVRVTLTEKDPEVFWRRVNDFDLFLPSKNDAGTIEIGEPVNVSRLCIGFSSHSGIPSSIVSRGEKVHVVWAEATDPDKEVPGVPTFVATYDRTTKTLSEPALVGYGPPANDVHNTPSITMDSEGYLHVLIGTHGRTFRYARSLVANDASNGFSEAEDLGPGLRQTYIGLVCDKEDTLHAVFRLWQSDAKYFPASLYASLAYMRKERDNPWSEPQPLVVAPFSEYSVYYHRLTIDRAGNPYLSYDYWSTFWFYRNDHRGDRRALMMSPDRGASWKLADQLDMPD